MFSACFRRACWALVFWCLWQTSDVCAAGGTWIGTADGDWAVPGNWAAGGIADGVDAVALFSNNLTGPRTVTLGSSRTVGGLVFSDADPLSAGSWALQGPGTLSLEVTAGQPTISVTDAETTLGVALAGKAFVKSGPGTLVLTGNNSFTTPTLAFAAADPGVIRLGSNTALGGIMTVSMPATNGLVSRVDLTGDVTLTADLTTAGRNTFPVFLRNVSGNNVWNGDITISNTGGNYSIESATGMLTLGGRLSSGIANSRTFILSGAGNGVVSGGIANGASTSVGLRKEGGGVWTLAAANTFTGQTTIAAGSLEVGTNGSLGTGEVVNHSRLNFRQTNGLTVTNPISGTGTVGVLAGNLTLAGVSAWSGGTQVVGERHLSVADDAALGTGTVTLGDVPGSPQIWFQAAGDRTLANAFEVRTQRWIIDANAINGNAAGALTVTGAVNLNQSGAKDIYCNKPLTLTGGLTSTGGLTKQGGSLLTIAGNATYNGATSVSMGTLAVEGAITGPGTVTVASGATLTGSGAVSGPVSVSGGGKLIPGKSGAGRLATGSLTLASTATLQFTAGAPEDASNTRIDITGNLSANGTLLLNAGPGFTDGTYTLASVTGNIAGAGFQTLAVPNGFIGSIVAGTPNQLKVRVIRSSAVFPRNHVMLSLTDSLTLDWTPPVGAVAYDVYLGTDAAAVGQATPGTGGPIYKGRVTGDEFTAGGFSHGVTNYWRIDFVFADGTVVKGTLWDFTLVAENDLMADTWVATDALNRTLPGYAKTGPPRSDRPVAIFYFLWHNKGGLGSDGPRDNTKEIQRLGGYTDRRNPWADNPLWMTGSNGRSWYWGEPEAGYYAADDEWVIRRHLMLLTAAGVDILAFDNTNGHPESYQASFIRIAETIRKLRREGMKIDLKFLFVTHGGTGGSPATMTWLYENFYKPGLYPELWQMWNGKPVIMGYPDGLAAGDTPVSDEVRNFFTMRTGWANTTALQDEWQWIDSTSPQNWGYSGRPDVPEQVPVACGGWCNGNLGRSYSNRSQPAYDNFHLTAARTENEGRFFSEQIFYGLKLDPKLMFITGWNEWWAGAWTAPAKGGGYRILDNFPEIGQRYFVDNYNAEYSRDIEPMKGGFGDNYYYQMVAANRMRKGTRPLPAASAAKVVAAGDVAAFADVEPVYRDAPDETLPRAWPGTFSNLPDHANTTGRNDFRVLKVARDAANLYFYAETKNAITPDTGANWMLLFLDADQDHATGWEGYDYVINLGARGTVKRFSGTTWAPVDAGTAAVHVSGNTMVITVARSTVGLAADPLKFDFHWVDNVRTPGDIADFGVSGDSAPERRFNYRYQAATVEPLILREDDFENDGDPSWAETFTPGGRWSLSTVLPYSGSNCLLGKGSSNASSAGIAINRLDTAGLDGFRVGFRYKLANIMDAQDIRVQYLDRGGNWVAVRELGRDQFHPAGQQWGYDERQNVWLYFTDSRSNSGADAAFFHAGFAIRIDLSGLNSDTQTIALDDLQVSGARPLLPPDQASVPAPAHGAQTVPVATGLAWMPGTRAQTQRVYFGPPDHLQLIATLDGTTAFVALPDTLAYGSGYAWRVDGVNPAGSTSGATWTFTAEPQPNRAPVMAALPDLTVIAGQTMDFTVTASDADLPAQLLNFRFINAPAGASMGATTARFLWRPSIGQAPGDYPVTLEVADNGSPPLSHQQAFTVHVAAPVSPEARSPRVDADGVFRLWIHGDAGPDYRIFSSQDLVEWTLMRTVTPAVMPYLFEDGAAPDHPKRFYRFELGP